MSVQSGIANSIWNSLMSSPIRKTRSCPEGYPLHHSIRLIRYPFIPDQCAARPDSLDGVEAPIYLRKSSTVVMTLDVICLAKIGRLSTCLAGLVSTCVGHAGLVLSQMIRVVMENVRRQELVTTRGNFKCQ